MNEGEEAFSTVSLGVLLHGSHQLFGIFFFAGGMRVLGSPIEAQQ